MTSPTLPPFLTMSKFTMPERRQMWCDLLWMKVIACVCVCVCVCVWVCACVCLSVFVWKDFPALPKSKPWSGCSYGALIWEPPDCGLSVGPYQTHTHTHTQGHTHTHRHTHTHSLSVINLSGVINGGGWADWNQRETEWCHTNTLDCQSAHVSPRLCFILIITHTRTHMRTHSRTSEWHVDR